MLLKVGSKGEDVKKLQTKLGTNPDGSFGPVTEKLVKAWQKENGLTQDGIVGDTTWGKMGLNENLNKPTTTPANSKFKLEALKGHIPDSVIAQIPDAAIKFNITTSLRLAHFLAQCSHESGGFKVAYENLNYSSKGLKGVFGKYFPGNLADEYARKPEKIANRVYASRMGNGNEASGDGFKFRGKGYIQLTGKDNHALFNKFVDDDIIKNPDLVATKYPLASAGWFFDHNNLWKTCDLGSNEDTVKSVTKRVNGGYNGLDDRIAHFKEFYTLLK